MTLLTTHHLHFDTLAILLSLLFKPTVMPMLSLFITATDHVGRSTMSQSPGVTVDSTPPDVSAVPMDVGGSYVTERKELSVTWRGIFSDDESGENTLLFCILQIAISSKLYNNAMLRFRNSVKPAQATTCIKIILIIDDCQLLPICIKRPPV